MSQKKSKYAEKKARGNMMYGPGCCGHTLTPEQMRAIRMRNNTFRTTSSIRSFNDGHSESGYDQNYS